MSERKRVVLVGAGHGHLVALQGWRGRSLPFELVVVDPGRFRYSGMATGVLSGDYDGRAASLGPAGLVRAAGGTLVADRVTAVDRSSGSITLDGGDQLAFDALSLNVGSVNAAGPWDGVDGLWGTKPVGGLHRLAEVLGGLSSPRIVVIGGGMSGTEIACCIAARPELQATVTLIDGEDTLLPGAPTRMRTVLVERLETLGVRRLGGRRASGVSVDHVLLDDGRSLEADAIVVAAGLEPAPLVRSLGLPLGDGGLLVAPTLNCPDAPRIFAVGDCADIDGAGLPDVGVYGVRAAPVLAANLVAWAKGEPLRPYRPQRRYLSIMNLGQQQALASWGGLTFSGRIAWWLKDRIDRRFVDGLKREKN